MPPQPSLRQVQIFCQQIGGTLAVSAGFGPRMDEEIIKTLRARVAKCRRLAWQTLDDEVAKMLLQIADEGEAEMKQLELQRDAGTNGDVPLA